LWRLIALASATIPALNLHSNLDQLEEPATRHHHRHEEIYLAIICVVCLLSYLLAVALFVGVDLLAVAGRGWLAWYGFALVCGRILSWQLAWVLPAIVGCLLIFVGGGGQNGYAWWEFTIQPISHAPTLILSVAAAATGILAFSYTPSILRSTVSFARNGR